MRHIFDIERTARTYELHGGSREHAELLEEMLRQITRCLGRRLPGEVGRRIDEEGSRLRRDEARDGALLVERHPELEAARRELAAIGLFRVFLPEDVGGLDLPVGLYYLAVQLVSYFDTSLALVFLVQGNAMYVINRYGSNAQRRRYLPPLASGEKLATVAFTEPRAGSDAGRIETRAVRQGDSFLLDGVKSFITHGGDADILVTTARTGPMEEEIRGISTFIVERQGDGVEVLGLEHKTGLGGSPTAQLAYSGVHLPADRLLGPLGRGGEVMLAGVGMTRVNIGAQALGIAKRAFDAATDFALSREQGGCRIVEHDAVQQRLLDITLAVSSMENLLCHVASLEERELWHVREMSLAKYYCSEALQEVTTRAIAVHGGYGVCREYGVERCRREAAALPLYGGTSEIQWLIIARELLETVAGRARVDYRARDEQEAERTSAACRGRRLARLARSTREAQRKLWQAVELVAALDDPAPYHRTLADWAVAAEVAGVLLRQAARRSATPPHRAAAARNRHDAGTSAGGGDHSLPALELGLAEMAVEALEEQAAAGARRIRRKSAHYSLKRALRHTL